MNTPDTDERYGHDLMGPLGGEPDSPSRIDLLRAIDTGRRRRRHQRIAGAGAAAAVMIAGVPVVLTAIGHHAHRRDTSDVTPAPTPTPTAPSTCTPTPLPAAVAGADTTVTGGDPTGRWHVGRSHTANGGDLAVMWHDGELVKLTPASGTDPQMNDINAAGTAVGRITVGNERRPVAYTGGTAVELSGVSRGRATAVNDAGTIVGIDEGQNLSEPVRWQSATKPATALPLPAGYDGGMALGIDEDGTIVGLVTVKGKHSLAYLWRADGTGEPLPLPTIDGKKATSFGPDTIRNGVIFGDAVNSDASVVRPYRYRVATRQFEPIADDKLVFTAANGNGWAVGYRSGARSDAVLLAGPREIVLPAADLGAGETGTRATAISDDGRTVAGYSMDGTNLSRPTLWRCH